MLTVVMLLVALSSAAAQQQLAFTNSTVLKVEVLLADLEGNNYTVNSTYSGTNSSRGG
jgi:hypothetical protein